MSAPEQLPARFELPRAAAKRLTEVFVEWKQVEAQLVVGETMPFDAAELVVGAAVVAVAAVVVVLAVVVLLSLEMSVAVVAVEFAVGDGQAGANEAGWVVGCLAALLEVVEIAADLVEAIADSAVPNEEDTAETSAEDGAPCEEDGCSTSLPEQLAQLEQLAPPALDDTADTDYADNPRLAT